jgi:hypothetical protein
LGLLINGTEDDHSFSMTMVKYWSNFAKTGWVFILCLQYMTCQLVK